MSNTTPGATPDKDATKRKTAGGCNPRASSAKGGKMRKRTTKVIHHANRYEQFDEAFLRYLGRYLPGFKGHAKDVRLALCGMIYEAPTRYRAHSHHEGYSRFTWQELEQSFGRKGFTGINQSLGLFEVLHDAGREDWSVVEGRTKAYMLTKKVSDIRANFLKGCFRRKPTKLLMRDGKELQSLPASAMAAKNKDGQNRRGFQNLPVSTLVPVNLVQIKKLMVNIEARLLAHDAGFVQVELLSEVPNTKFLKSLHEDAAMIVCKARSKNWPGFVLHRYFEIESGRVYADGVGNLQNCYRVLREAAMAGLYDVDIENCHYSILAQMAASSGYQCTAVLDYLSNKKAVRESLATEFGISTRQAKDALIALIYGAKFSGREEDALPKIFNSTKLAARIYKHPKFLALQNDITGARQAVLAAQPVTRQTIKNCRGLVMRLAGSNERQQLAHLLQGVEVTALEAAYRLYPNEIVLLQHDGFAATCPLDTKRIEQAMLGATGYRLEVEQKVIQVNLGDAFDAHPHNTNNQIDKLPFFQWQRADLTHPLRVNTSIPSLPHCIHAPAALPAVYVQANVEVIHTALSSVSKTA